MTVQNLLYNYLDFVSSHFISQGNEFFFHIQVRRLEEDMDKASCIARRKLLCREWTEEEIRFIHENLAVLKHNAFTTLALPSSESSFLEKGGSSFSLQSTI